MFNYKLNLFNIEKQKNIKKFKNFIEIISNCDIILSC